MEPAEAPRGGMVYLQGSGATATKLGAARTWSIKIDKDLKENNVLGDTWVTQLMGLQKWSGKVDGLLDTTETSPWDAQVATGTKKLYLYPDLSAATRYYYGTVWVKGLGVDDKLGADPISYTLDFDGDGQLATN